jgi:deoxyribose-phosphate aldolase
MDRATLAKYVDHTLLKPEATADDVIALCNEANELGVFSVCVSPSFVQVAKASVATGIAVATVCGFPSGKHETQIKAAEAELSIAQGADEVDMVIDVGRGIMGDWDYVQNQIAEVRKATKGKLLKVILETAALNDDQIKNACLASDFAGADFVKTSTGFHPTGGAELRAIKIMQSTVGSRLGIKASGGIRDAKFALELIEAGATRLGLSGTRAVLDGVTSTDNY